MDHTCDKCGHVNKIDIKETVGIMGKIREKLKNKKTYIVSILMALVALVDLLTGSISLVEFVQSDHIRILLDATGLATIRAAIAKMKGPIL